jgi:hypothetical protein
MIGYSSADPLAGVPLLHVFFWSLFNREYVPNTITHLSFSSGLVVSVMIVRAGWTILKEVVYELTDKQIDTNIRNQVIELLNELKNDQKNQIKDFHNLRYKQSAIFLSLCFNFCPWMFKVSKNGTLSCSRFIYCRRSQSEGLWRQSGELFQCQCQVLLKDTNEILFECRYHSLFR